MVSVVAWPPCHGLLSPVLLMILCGGEPILQTLPTSALPCLPKDTRSSLSSHGGTGAPLLPFSALSSLFFFFLTTQYPELSRSSSLCDHFAGTPTFSSAVTLSSFWPDPTPRWDQVCLIRFGMVFPYFHLGHKGTQSPGVLWVDIWVLLLGVLPPEARRELCEIFKFSGHHCSEEGWKCLCS